MSNNAIELRQQALALLQEAQAIDNLKPFVVMHVHDFGETPYIGWAEHGFDETEAQRLLQVKYEPERGERLSIGSVALDELLGVDPTPVSRPPSP